MSLSDVDWGLVVSLVCAFIVICIVRIVCDLMDRED